MSTPVSPPQPTAEPVRRKFAGKEKPAPYDLNDTGEIYRLLSECWGYLHTCHRQHGTDWEGRQFAMNALDALMHRDFKLVPNPVEGTPGVARGSRGPS